jgi:hypothetical protein
MALVEPWLLPHLVLYYPSPRYNNVVRGEVEAGEQICQCTICWAVLHLHGSLLIVRLRVHAAEC